MPLDQPNMMDGSETKPGLLPPLLVYCDLPTLHRIACVNAACRDSVQEHVRGNLRQLLPRAALQCSNRPKMMKWLCKLAGREAVEELSPMLVSLATLATGGLLVSEVLVEAGLTLRTESLVAAARRRIPGIEDWMPAFQRAGVPAGLDPLVEAIMAVPHSYSSIGSSYIHKERTFTLLLPRLQEQREQLEGLLHLAVNCRSSGSSVSLLTAMQNVLPQFKLSCEVLVELMHTAVACAHTRVISMLTKQPAATEVSPAAATALLRACFTANEEPQRVCFATLANNLPAVQQLAPDDVFQLLQAFMLQMPARSHAAKHLLQAICKLPGSQQLQASQLQAIILDLLWQQQYPLVKTLAKQIPAAQQLGTAAAEQVIMSSVCTGNYSTINKTLVCLEPAEVLQQLEAPSLQRLLEAALQRSAVQPLLHHLLQLAASQQLTSAGVAVLVRQFIISVCGCRCATTGDFSALCRLPGAQQLSMQQIEELLVEATRSRPFNMAPLFTVPAVHLLSEASVHDLLIRAVQACNISVIEQLCKLVAAASLTPQQCRQLMQDAIRVAKDDSLGSMLHALGSLSPAGQLTCEDVTTLQEACISAGQPDGFVALCRLPKAAEVVEEQQLALLRMALRDALDRNYDASLDDLGALPAAKLLQPAELRSLLSAKISRHGPEYGLSGLLSFTGLPAAQQLTPQEVAALANEAMRARLPPDDVKLLLELPGAEGFGQQELAAVLQVAAQVQLPPMLHVASDEESDEELGGGHDELLDDSYVSLVCVLLHEQLERHGGALMKIMLETVGCPASNSTQGGLAVLRAVRANAALLSSSDIAQIFCMHARSGARQVATDLLQLQPPELFAQLQPADISSMVAAAQELGDSNLLLQLYKRLTPDGSGRMLHLF